MSTTVAKLVAEVDATGITKGVTEIAKVAPEAVKAEAGVDRLRNASKGMDAAMLAAVKAINDNTAALRALTASNEASAAVMAKATSAATAYAVGARKAAEASAALSNGFRLGTKDMDAHVLAFRKFQEAGDGVVKMSGRTQAGLLNLSRQLTDVGVTAAMGMNPLMILIQQGPQIADALGEVKAGGMGVSAAFKQVAAGVWAAIAPLAPFIAAVAAVAAVLGGAFLLGARNAHQATGDLTKGLGLTEAQMEKVKQKTVTVGDTFLATFTVIGRHIMDGPIGDGLKWMGDAWGKTLDWITDKALGAAATIIAAFTAAAKAAGGADFGESFTASKAATLKGFDSFFGEITKEAAARRTKQIKKEAGKGHSAATPRDQTDERTAQVDALLASAMQDELQARLGLTKDIMARAAIEKQISAAALAEKQANVEKQIAAIADDKGLSAAKKATLIAQLGVVEALNKSAALAREAAQATEAEATLIEANAAQRQRIADYYDQIAGLSADMASTAAERNRIEDAALGARQRVERQVLDAAQEAARLRASQDAVETAKLASSQAAERLALADLQGAQRAAQLRTDAIRIQEEVTAVAEATLGAQRDALQSQAGLAQSNLARHNIDRELLEIDQKLRRSKLEELALSGDKGALAALLGLGDREKNEKLALAQNELIDAYTEASGALTGMAGALKRGDWTGFASSLKTFTSLLQSLKGSSTTSKIGAVGGIAQGIGSAIGGTGGAALAGAGAGAVAGVAVGGAAVSLGLLSAAALAGPVGWAIAGVGALAGAILGLGGASKKAKQAAEEQRKAEAERQAQVAKQRDDLNINILVLEGKATEALAAKRASEATQIDATNMALKERLDALQDARDLENMQIRLLQAQGKAGEALALTRKQEMDATTDALKPLLAQIYAAEDLAQASQVASTAQDIEIATMDAMGLKSAATNARRADELAELANLDPALVKLKQGLYDAEDAATAAATALSVSNEARGLEIRRLTAMGDTAGATRLQREAEIEGYSDANKGLARFVFALEDFRAAANEAAETAKKIADAQRDVWVDAYNTAQQNVTTARTSLQTAYDSAAQTITGLKDRYQSIADGLGKTLSDLAMGDLGGASVASRYRAARAQFDRVSAQAALGDAAAGEALPQVISQFLALSKEASKSRFDQLRDAALARAAAQNAQAVALRQVDIQAEALQALKDQVSGLGIVTDTVKSGSADIVTAIGNLATAMAAAGAAGSKMDSQWGAIANVGVNQRLAAATGYTGAFGSGDWQRWITDAARTTDQTAAARAILTSSGEANRIVGFATGGEGTVAGHGGPDSKLVSMRLTPGELVNVRRPGQSADNAALIAEVRGLREELRAIRTNTGQGAKSAESLEVGVDRLTKGYKAMPTQAA